MTNLPAMPPMITSQSPEPGRPVTDERVAETRSSNEAGQQSKAERSGPASKRQG